MPRPIFEVWVSHDDVCLELVCDAADRFGMPADSAALRMLGLTRAPCAAVYTVDGRVKWWARTLAFEVIVPWGRRVDERTRAAALHSSSAAAGRGRRGGDMRTTGIASAAWGGGEEEGELLETAIPLPGGHVLTWLVSQGSAAR